MSNNVKYEYSREIKNYKAHLVSKRYTQVEGSDFIEKISLVTKMMIVGCLLSVVVGKGWEIHKMDVSNAFFHGELEEEVYL